MLLNYKGLLCDPKILLFLPSLLETMNIFFNIILPSEQMGSPENFKLWGKHHFWLFSFFYQENLNETIAFSGPGFEIKHFKFNTTVLWGQRNPNQIHPALLNHVVSLFTSQHLLCMGQNTIILLIYVTACHQNMNISTWTKSTVCIRTICSQIFCLFSHNIRIEKSHHLSFWVLCELL